MKPIILHPTSTAQWHALVSEAKQLSGISMDEDLESYLVFLLVFLLMRYIQEVELAASVLGLDYLESKQALVSMRKEQLREVGDKCLLHAGLFPERAERKQVKVSYFIDLGRLSYSELSDLWEKELARLFTHLSHHFVTLTDVLQAMRCMDVEERSLLKPLEAIELWYDTGNESALRALNGEGSLPVFNHDVRNKPRKSH